MRRAVATTLLVLVGAVEDAIVRVGAQPNPATDDRAILQLVIDEIGTRVSSPILAGPRQGGPIVVVEGGRPLCREKVYERDPPWPLMCGGNRRGFAEILTKGTQLSEQDRTELVQSVAERNTTWKDLPSIDSRKIVWLPRQEYIDGEYPRNLAVVSLPGYSKSGYAVLAATFSCGNVCGTGWYVVLHHVDGAWRILKFISTGIS